MARPARLELATLCLEGRRSIQLSYGRIAYIDFKPFFAKKGVILLNSWSNSEQLELAER
jgi:hypothetical protein